MNECVHVLGRMGIVLKKIAHGHSDLAFPSLFVFVSFVCPVLTLAQVRISSSFTSVIPDFTISIREVTADHYLCRDVDIKI